MRLITNEKLVERQSKYARYATFAGLATLIGSLVTTFTNNFPLAVAYALLFVGFILAYIGAVLANRWVKEPRADVALAKALKGFDNRHHLYNYLLPARHVLLTPSGLLVFRVKSNDGVVTVNGDKWFTPFRWSRLFGGMGQEALGNPPADLEADVTKLRQFLAGKFQGADNVPVDGYLVFTDPNVDLKVENPTAPVVRVQDLKDTIRKSKRGPTLSTALFDETARVLDEEAHAKAA
jgi:hypothetical protein